MPRQYEKVFWQLVQTAARIYIKGNCFLSRSDSHRVCKIFRQRCSVFVTGSGCHHLHPPSSLFDTVSIHGVCVHFMEMR